MRMSELIISGVIVILFIAAILHGNRVVCLEHRVADLDWENFCLKAELNHLKRKTQPND